MSPIKMLMFIVIAFFIFSGCNSEVTVTDGDTTDGDITENDITDGDTPDGDATEDDITDGDTIDNDTTEDDITDGDITENDITDGDTIDNDTTEDDITDGDTIDNDTTEDDITDGDNIDNDTTEDEITDGDTTEDDATVTLEWQNPPADNTMNWNDAMSYCNTLTLENKNDWRLPTLSELRTLIRNCPKTESDGTCDWNDDCISMCDNTEDCAGCTAYGAPVNDCYWDSDMQGTCHWYWSSLESANKISSWVVYFHSATVNYANKVNLVNVRCVRNDADVK